MTAFKTETETKNENIPKITYTIEFVKNIKKEMESNGLLIECEELKKFNWKIIPSDYKHHGYPTGGNNNWRNGGGYRTNQKNGGYRNNNNRNGNHYNNNRNHYNNNVSLPLPIIECEPLVVTDKGWKREIKLETLLPFDEKLMEIIYRYYKSTPPDIKKINGLLNKLSPKNEEKIIQDIRNLNYTSEKIVEIIFKKAVAEPFYAELYAKMCSRLSKIRPLIQKMCIDEFQKNKHKNLCKFIGELYKRKIIISIHGILDTLTVNESESTAQTDIEKNVEILYNIMLVVGTKRGVFDKSFEFLESISPTMTPRFKYMILDLTEFRSGKRIPPKRTAKMR